MNSPTVDFFRGVNMSNMVVEVGNVELLQLGMFGKPGEAHRIAVDRLSLAVLNDCMDARYEVSSGGETRVIEPGGDRQNCVLLIARPNTPEALIELASPSRLFHYDFEGHRWPTLLFQFEGSASGPYDTACVVMDRGVSWTSVVGGPGHFTMEGSFSDECYAWEWVRTEQGDKRTQVFDRPIDKIAIVDRSGKQQACCTTGWPP